MNRVLILALALAACDDETPADLDPCAAQDPSTTDVAETQEDDAFPAPAGGTIEDGTYDLSRFEVYAPATADDTMRARRLVFDGDTFVSINVTDGGDAEQIGGTWSTTDTNLVFDVACPSTQTVTIGYTVSGDELWLHDDAEPNVQVYTRVD